MKTISNFLLCLAFISVISSCEKAKDDAPAIPPVETMQVDMSLFDTTATDGKKSALVAYDSLSNWHFAAANVGLWSLAVYVHSAIPVWAFGESFKYKAEFKDNATWEWKYTFGWFGEYDARLTAKVNSETTDWSMHISRLSHFENVEWFTGVSANDGMSGQWILNKFGRDEDPATVEPYLQVDWLITDDEVNSVKYTLVEDGAVGEGNYLQFGLNNSDGVHDVFFDIVTLDGGSANDVEIKWHRSNHFGRIKYQPWFGDANWHCWDERLVNTTCE